MGRGGMLEGTLVSAAIKNLSVGRFGRKADGRNGLLCSDGDGAGETEEEDYVETAHDMQDERLTSTLSNLFAHGCVAWLQCRLFSEMYGIK